VVNRDIDDIDGAGSGQNLECSPDESDFEWESNASLRREQIRMYLNHQDELERNRLTEVAEADEQLFGLLQRYRYDDAEFLEDLDPELALEIAEREAAADYEAFAAYEPSADHGSCESQSTEPDPETTQIDSGQAMNLALKIEILERLANLRRIGAITEVEFEALKLEALQPAEE
jgi:hypothetical protein